MDYANTRIHNVADPWLYEFASGAAAASHQCLGWDIQFTRVQVPSVYHLLSISFAHLHGNVQSYVFFSSLFLVFSRLLMGCRHQVPTFISISSESMGIDPNMAFYLLAIINGSSGLARCFAGWLADHTGTQNLTDPNMCCSFHNNLDIVCVGAINLMAPMSIFGAMMTFIWPFVRTEPWLVVVATLYG